MFYKNKFVFMFLFFSFYGKINPKGHVIAARITAENPDEVCLRIFI